MEKRETPGETYIREQEGGYLLLSIPQREESYKEEMLQNNRIAGLVPVKTQAFNEYFQYRYEIGNRISLAEQFHRTSPGTAEIRTLMRQIEDTGKLLEGYLLSQEDMLLSLRDIYFDGKEYCFMYLPDHGRDVREQLAGLFEELMNCLDYEDRSSVSLVYLLHARIRQKGSGILSLHKLCEEILEAQTEEERSYLEARDFNEMYVPQPAKYSAGGGGAEDLTETGRRPEREKNRKRGKGLRPQKSSEGNYGGGEQSRKEKDRNGKEEKEKYKKERNKRRGHTGEKYGEERDIRERGQKQQDNSAWGKKQYTETEQREEIGFRAAFEKLQKLFRRAGAILPGGAPDTMAEMSGEFEPWEEDEAESAVYRREAARVQESNLLQDQFDTMPLGLLPNISEDTILLGSAGEQYVLEPMESGRARIIPDRYPFELGKEKSGQGYVFPDSVISRRHARLIQENGKYYISDLNSLNGTTVNGERLMPNIRRELAPGDIIGLAEIYYIFTCLKRQDDV